jgi:proteic killer suppression protein
MNPGLVPAMNAQTRGWSAHLCIATTEDARLPPGPHLRAFKKLAILNASVALENLKVPPGNHLEALHGNRAGQHSIRINDQYRVCFVWRDGNAFDVEIVDYH